MHPLSRILISDATQNSAAPFVCPGCSTGISRAVHLARLNAGWDGCDRCEWRFDTEGLAERTKASVEWIQEQRADGIYRTECGLRGQYLNQLTRNSAARLAQVFCDSFINSGDPDTPGPSANSQQARLSGPGVHTEHSESMPWQQTTAFSGLRTNEHATRRDADDIRLQRAAIPNIVAGYDGRPSSPDIFAGVVAAVRESGLNVIDIGRCTAASISEAVRSLPHACGSILVTGAGYPAVFTGMDVFDRHGEPVPVVWKDHGLRIRAAEQRPASTSGDAASGAREVRESFVESLLPKKDSTSRGFSLSRMMLDLPVQWLMSCPGRRLSRQSGQHDIADVELRYREWLVRWFPPTTRGPVVVHTDDLLIAERVRWLAETAGMNVVVRTCRDQQHPANGSLNLHVHEDDRSFQISNRQGHRYSPTELADVINRSHERRPGHVTAHADSASGRFWLTDRARPTSDRMEEHIRDSLAVLGLLLRLE